MIYLDNAATTRISEEVINEMNPYLDYRYGNPYSSHSFGRESRDAILKAKRRVAKFVNASPEQIIFTSGGSESNSTAIIGTRKYLSSISKEGVITSNIEHDSVFMSAKTLSGVLIASPDSKGVISSDKVEDLITDDIGLVSIMHTNNEIGSINPINEIGRICNKKGVLFHTDCVQSRTPLDVKRIGCDFLSLSSHKIGGSKGVGALYVKDIKTLSSIIFGSSSQQSGLRGGTLNVAGIVGFGKACDIISKEDESETKLPSFYKRLFFDILQEELKALGIERQVEVNGDSLNNDGSILNIRVNSVYSESLVSFLEMKGVIISAGSACRGWGEVSRTLKAIGLSDEKAYSSVRISFSNKNTPEEVKRAAKITAQTIEQIQTLIIH